jgi:hypothetical protein
MGMNYGFDIRAMPINFKVELNFRCWLLFSTDLFSSHVKGDNIFRCQESLALQGRSSEDTILIDTEGEIPLIGSHIIFQPNSSTDLTQEFFSLPLGKGHL